MYVAQSKFPKWLGIALGAMFAVIFAGTGLIILSLTRTTAPAAVAAAPSVAPAAAAAPVVAQAPAVQPEAAAAAATEASDEAAPAKASKHPRSSSGKARVAKRPGGLTDAKAKAILARHDTKAKAKQRDAIDKLLGM